jgi:exosortase A
MSLKPIDALSTSPALRERPAADLLPGSAPAGRRVRITTAMRDGLAAIGLGLLLLGLLFHQEFSAAVRVWIQSTAYNHYFLIIPLVAYLIWDRRAVLNGAVPQPSVTPALLAVPVGAAWLFADRVGIMEGRQLMAVTLIQILFLVLLGWRLYRALLGPLLYLYFLVPFGAFVTPALQDFTAAFTTHGLNLLGIPNFNDGYSIEIPQGTFYIAQACAGLRFLIAALAFGCLYALLMYRSPWRRGLFILGSIITPIAANGFRALGIVTLGYLLGSAKAAATDHVLYGWLFFSIVILLLVIFGLPFREDDKPAAPLLADATIRNHHSRLPALAAVLLLGTLGPLIAFALDRAAAATVPPAPQLPPGACTQTALDTAMPSPVAARITEQHLNCGAGRVTVMTAVFSPRVDPGAILSEERRLTGLKMGDVIATATLAEHGLALHLMQTEDPKHTAASAIWIDGAPASPGRAMRLRQAWKSIVGGHSAPVLIAVQPDPDPSAKTGGYQRARAGIAAWLTKQPSLSGALVRLTLGPQVEH